jgi:hypothetical protein
VSSSDGIGGKQSLAINVMEVHDYLFSPFGLEFFVYYNLPQWRVHSAPIEYNLCIHVSGLGTTPPAHAYHTRPSHPPIHIYPLSPPSPLEHLTPKTMGPPPYPNDVSSVFTTSYSAPSLNSTIPDQNN